MKSSQNNESIKSDGVYLGSNGTAFIRSTFLLRLLVSK